MSPPLVLIRQRCMDLCPDGPRSPSHDRARTRDAYSSHHRFSRRSHERYDQRVAYSDAPAHRRRPRSRESPPSRHLDFTSKSLSHLRGASPHGGPRRLRRGASPHGAPSRLLRSASHHGGYRRLLRRASPHGGYRRLLRGASPHGGPRRLLRGASPHGGPRRLLRGTSPHGGPRRLLRGASPHGGPRRLLRGTSPHGGPRRLLRGASPHGCPRRLLRGASPHGGLRRLLKGESPPRGHHHLSEWDSLQSQDLALPGDHFIGIFALQDAPPGTSSLHRKVPLRPNEDAMRRETLSPHIRSTHLELCLKSPLKSSIEAYMQDPLITIRVVIFASWRKNVLVQSLLLRANTLALVFMWIMAPISAILQGLDD